MKIGVNESRAKLACTMPSADNFLSVAKKSELSVQSVGSESNPDGMRSIISVSSVRGISSRSEKKQLLTSN